MILFSLVGMSDPIRNNFDGPLLHIVRHLKPDKVYIFHTAETTKRDKLDNRYELAIKSIDEDIEVIKFFSNITEVFIHESFSNVLKNEFYSVCENNQNERIIANITSGTQQMTSVLNLLISLGRYVVEAYQVTTPERGPNLSISTTEEFDINFEIVNNLDASYSKDSEVKNRLIKTDLLQYKKSLILNQVKSLVKLHYDYIGAIQLIEDSNIKVSYKLKSLLKLGRYRIALMRDKAKNYIETLKIVDLKYMEDKQLSKLVEYFQVIKIKHESSNYSEMILMFDPLTVKFQEIIIKRIFKINFRNLLERRKLSASKIQQHYPEIKKLLDEQFNGYINGEPNISVLNTMIKYWAKSEDYRELIKHLELLENLKNKRNEIAHELSSITKKEIEEIINIDIEYLLDNIRKLISKLFVVKQKHFSVYEVLNNNIYKEIELSL